MENSSKGPRAIKLRTKISIMVISIVLFLGLIELGLRFTKFNFNLPDYMKFITHPRLDTVISEGHFLKDPLLFWTLNPNSPRGQINSKGFRDREFSFNKPEGTFRIICLGDSVTYGVGVKSDQTYSKMLEKILNGKLPNQRFEVINAGVPGYSSLQGLKYLERDIIKYQPDLITRHFGPNDASLALNFSDKEQRAQPLFIINLQNILIRSRFYQLLSKMIFYLKNKISVQQDYQKSKYKHRVSPKDYKDNLEKMAEIAEDHNFRILFITPVFYKNGKVSWPNEYRLSDDVLYVDILSTFKKKVKEAKWLFIGDYHLTPDGHRIVAEEIYKTLMSEGIISGLSPTKIQQ